MLPKLLFAGSLLGLVDGFLGTTASNVLVGSDFSTSSLDPFVACNFKSPSYVASVDGRMKTYFDERDYDDTRDDRGVEICTTMDPVLKELWQGFNFYVPASYPYGRQSIVAQQFCLGYCSSWCGHVSIVDNSLVVEHRPSCGASVKTTVVANITRDSWHPIVVNARFSNSLDGHYVLYYDGVEVYTASDIDLGFDDAWNADGTMTTGVGFKNGQYNADTSLWTNTTRTLYFDNISWYNVDAGQTDGYEVVSP